MRSYSYASTRRRSASASTVPRIVAPGRRRRSKNLDPDAAHRACAQFDRTHEAYFRQFYGVQIQDPALYHVVLDSTAIGADACVEIIARAADCLASAPTGPSTNGPG
ncbi:MAG TPA: cytidylate kinase family protein [Solirubrobacteraceae bacterium]|nr:cytidylate kinase family protein [Solirubrobacteraceae bacterium]